MQSKKGITKPEMWDSDVFYLILSTSTLFFVFVSKHIVVSLFPL
jgi:hypothetical protein